LPEVAASNGKVALAEIVDGGIDLPMDKRVSIKEFRFRMPAGAKQGADTWYLMRVDLEVIFARGSRKGSVLVSGYTNDRAAAQIEFYTEQNSSGTQVTSWDSADAINGPDAGRFKSNRGHVRYVNYLQLSGVKPGINILTFAAERFGHPAISKINIGPASGIYASPNGPVDLDVNAHFSDDGLEVGESTHLEVEVTNASRGPAKDVELTVQPASSHLFIETPAIKQIKEFHRSTTRDFVVGSSQPGLLTVEVNAVAPNESEASSVVSTVVSSEEESGIDIRVLGLVVGLLFAGCATVIAIRKRKATR
jgi:hypothetical protein